MTPRSLRQAPIAAPLPETPSPIRLGLGANWRQFTLLVVVNAFVGAMVGLERTVVPLIAQADFGLVSKTIVLSFLVSFGIVKALANLFAGQLADRIGRKPLLVAGWLAGLPVPLLIIWAPSWGWIVFANVLLGVNQGLCWSTTVIMKIDLVGPARRGLAMGLNEFAGYVAVSLSALLTGYLAASHGLRPAPFYPGIAFAMLGLLFSVFAVRDTHGHARVEARQRGLEQSRPGFARVFLLTSWQDRAGLPHPTCRGVGRRAPRLAGERTRHLPTVARFWLRRRRHRRRTPGGRVHRARRNHRDRGADLGLGGGRSRSHVRDPAGAIEGSRFMTFRTLWCAGRTPDRPSSLPQG